MVISTFKWSVVTVCHGVQFPIPLRSVCCWQDQSGVYSGLSPGIVPPSCSGMNTHSWHGSPYSDPSVAWTHWVGIECGQLSVLGSPACLHICKWLNVHVTKQCHLQPSSTLLLYICYHCYTRWLWLGSNLIQLAASAVFAAL